MSTNNCPRCARSGVGACDDFPACQLTPEQVHGPLSDLMTTEEAAAELGVVLPVRTAGKPASVHHYPDLTRFEVIDMAGRSYTADARHGPLLRIELSFQDGGRTLKVLIS